MEWSKIKNIILLILVGLNAILLVMVAGQERESRRYQEEARAGVLEVLRRGGVKMEEDALPAESALRPMTAERDRAGEADLADALLTKARKTGDRGRDTYFGEKGTAWFRLDGSFGFTFVQGSWPLEGAEPAQHAQELLTGAGYPCQVTAVEVLGTGAAHVTVQETWEGTPLFSWTAVLIYRGGELRSIEEGTRLIGAPTETSAPATRLNVAAVLLHFLAGVREGGWLPGTVTKMTAGYEVTPGTGGQAWLEPVWELVTDVGAFYVDGTTGALRADV